MPTKYEKKRNFKKTPEPEWELKKSPEKKGIFVVQKHDASRLHYDFRLEIGGALKSWAVPKEISTNPKDKRLAVETEDHPMKYGNFEGIIPEGQYGGGTVMLWDKGTFENIKHYPLKYSYKKGHIEVNLKGKKLKGAYVLIKTKFAENSWLLIKMNDKYANKKIPNKDKSVKSGKTMRQIKGK